MQHHNAGRLTQAKSLYQDILKVEPNQPDSLHSLGVIPITKALDIRPDYTDAQYNFDNVLRELGKLTEAVPSNDKAGKRNKTGIFELPQKRI